MNGDLSFGNLIKKHRHVRDLTQAELARRVGCATITIRKIEAVTLRPSVQIAERLATVLDIPLDERAAFVRLARTALLADRSPPPVPTPPVMPEEVGQEDLSGRAIRGYELGERLGMGGFGAIYRAVQPLVEREVALKIILPQYADHPEFIRRFEAEAQLVARLEHPYIVPLYDYWREPGVAYLVMRLLRGGSLHTKLKAGPLPLDAATQLLEQVGIALHTAHRAGVIHRDIKPANILLDEEDNGYLADFGIAKNLGNPNLEEQTQVGAIIGSLDYISPEQIRAEPVRPQADIYCLGVVFYEMLTGHKPYTGPTPIDYIHQHLSEPLPPLSMQNSDLPATLDIVISRATAKNPLERYPDVLGLLADIRQAVGSGKGREAVSLMPTLPEMIGLVTLENPYKGLRAFSEADADDFYGREMLTQELLGRLGETEEPVMGSGRELGRFLAVVGPSGSGKSSLVKAGLLPALRRGGLPGSEHWFIIDFLPGAHPLEELEAALLRIAVNPPQSLLSQLREDERGLIRAAKRILPAVEDNERHAELVLVIDQFEEVFTLVENRAMRAHFLDSLTTAVLDPRSRVRVIITLRADFTDRPLQYVDFGELVRQRTAFVLPLTPEELEQAIRRPAERVGLTLEPGVVATIIKELGDQPGILPLLQYALTELFERREGGTLTLAAYQDSGGVLGALARRADELYEGLDQSSQDMTRQLFLRFVTLGEGTSDSPAPDTRRRVLLSELTALTIETTGDGLTLAAAGESGNQAVVIRQVIDQFGRYRLLTFDHDPVTRSPTVEIAHEALLREWNRLRQWLDDSREDVRLQRQLTVAANEWFQAEKDEGYLLRGARLDQFMGWEEHTAVALTKDERSFLEASQAARRDRQAEEETRQQHELKTARKLAETEKQRAEEQHHAAQRLRKRAIFLAGALLVAAVLAVAAFVFGQQARQEARLATSRELAAAALNDLVVDPERSILLAMQGLSTAHTLEAENALHKAISASRVELTLTGHTAEVWGVAYHPDGMQVATSSSDGTIKLWDSSSGRELRTLARDDIPVFFIAYNPDGTRLAAAYADGTVTVWSLETGQVLQTLSGHVDLVFDVAFSPDGKYLATGSVDQTAKIWDVQTGEALLTLSGYERLVNYVAFSPDGNLLAAGGEDGSVRIWDTATLLSEGLTASTDTTGRELVNLQVAGGSHNGATFSPDGKYLATGTETGLVKVWDIESSVASVAGQELLTLRGHTGPVVPTAFSPDGLKLATGSFDGTAKVWDAQSGQELFTLAGHASGILSLAFSPDGNHLITANWDGTAKVWNLSASRELLTLAAHSDDIHSLIFSPDGKQLVTSGEDGTAKIWRLDTSLFNHSGQLLATLSGHTDSIMDVAFSPDGAYLATAGEDGVAKIWDVTSGRDIFTLTGHTPGEYLVRYEGVTGIAYSPDGMVLATVGNDGTVRIWDAATGQEILTWQGHLVEYSAGSPFLGAVDAAFSPDGTKLVTAGTDGKAIVWDIATALNTKANSPEILLILSDHKGDIVHVAFSNDGTQLATASLDATAKVWDAESGELLHTLSGHTGIVETVTFNPIGTHLATGGEDGTAKVWDIETGEVLLTLGHTDFVETVTFSPDGTRLITAGPDGMVRVYILPIETLMTFAKSRVTRSLTIEECFQYLHSDTCPAGP